VVIALKISEVSGLFFSAAHEINRAGFATQVNPAILKKKPKPPENNTAIVSPQPLSVQKHFCVNDIKNKDMLIINVNSLMIFIS
jgi:hypothetical protein